MALEQDHIVKIRGLPWTASAEEINKFFSDCRIKGEMAGIHLTLTREGRPSGEAFIEMESEEDANKALLKDHQNMGHRYIEVFKTNRADMEWIIQRTGRSMESVVDDCCVRLRGLPFGYTKEDIADFFSGLQIVPKGICIPNDNSGRPSGEAYVQFIDTETVEKALKKHLEKIGHRYIEVFRSSLAEVQSQTGPKIRPLMSELVTRPAPYHRPSRYGGRYNDVEPRGYSRYRSMSAYDDEFEEWMESRGGYGASRFGSLGGYGGRGYSSMDRMRYPLYEDEEEDWYVDPGTIVHMRGLPFMCTEQDICDFFRPIAPVDIQIIYEDSGRPSGRADVEFASYEDALRAMKKDKQNMHNRYIELFHMDPTDSASRNRALPSVSRGARGGTTRGVGRLPPLPSGDGVTSAGPTLYSRRGVGVGGVGGASASVSGVAGVAATAAAVAAAAATNSIPDVAYNLELYKAFNSANGASI